MKADPKVGTTCAGCEKPRRLPKRNHNKAESGTRMPSNIWIAALELDPFCSTECCRAYHGTSLKRGAVSRLGFGYCADCGCELPPRNEKAGIRCYACSDKHKRQRRFNEPGKCAGCGCEIAGNHYTTGCYHCGDRRRNRARRTDPVYRAREAERTLERKRRVRREKLAAAGRVATVEPLSREGSRRGSTPVPEAEEKEAA